MRLSEPTNVLFPESGGCESEGARIVGKGEMAGLVRTYDWASTSLGPIEHWSRELVAIVSTQRPGRNGTTFTFFPPFDPAFA